MKRFSKPLLEPKIRHERDLITFVARATVVCVATAVAVDVVNQLVFFVSWSVALRSWALTTLVALVVSIPILLSIGKANLNLHRAKDAVERLSLTDPLTGLPNRRAIFNYAEDAAGLTLILMIVDVDRFKSVNDSFGHRIGDAVLVSIAERMSLHLRDLGLIGRLGGEEFAFLSHLVAPETVLERVAELCRQLSEVPIVAHGQSVRVTVSVGAARGQRIDDLYTRADKALYAAKAAGRNRICVAPELQDLLPAENSLEQQEGSTIS